MQKVFLYLYPIEEYTKMFENGNSLTVLNECIQRRYREKGYQVVFALYPDKNIYGIIPQTNDKLIYTDIIFTESSAIDENGKNKENFIPKYPSEKHLIEQLGNIDELVVGGYHAQDCVRRVCECALDCGINSIIDLDMTGFFFHLYKKTDYFKIEEYSPTRYKQLMLNRMSMYGDEFAENLFNRNYSSPAYGFNKEENKKK